MDCGKGSFKRNLILVLAAAILGGLGLGFWQFLKFNDGKLHLVFCDVGQGDAIYLKTPAGQEVLIDGGPNEKVLDCLSSRRPFYDREIEVVILTHPQADHLTGLISILKRYKIDYFITENISNQSAVFKEFHQAISAEGVQIYNPKAGDRLRLGETEINFYWPKAVIGSKNLWRNDVKDGDSPNVSGDLNNYSLVFDVHYKNFLTLQTGDAESQILEEIGNLATGVTVLKVPHHGSKNAVNEIILKKLQPKLAIISVGKGNHFGHPAEQIIKVLEDLAIKTLRTDREGEVEVVSDGESWWVRGL